MRFIHSPNTSSYSYILTEDEWYSGTEQQKEAWRVECKRKAREAGCRHANILVDPDATMSLSPVNRRHAVWGYAEPDVGVDTLRTSVLEACVIAENKGLSIKDIVRTVRAVLKDNYE